MLEPLSFPWAAAPALVRVRLLVPSFLLHNVPVWVPGNTCLVHRFCGMGSKWSFPVTTLSPHQLLLSGDISESKFLSKSKWKLCWNYIDYIDSFGCELICSQYIYLPRLLSGLLYLFVVMGLLACLLACKCVVCHRVYVSMRGNPSHVWLLGLEFRLPCLETSSFAS